MRLIVSRVNPLRTSDNFLRQKEKFSMNSRKRNFPARCLRRSRLHSRVFEQRSRPCRANGEGDARSRRARGLAWTRETHFSTPPASRYRAPTSRPRSCVSHGEDNDPSYAARRRVPRLANGVKIAARCCAPRRAGLHATRDAIIRRSTCLINVTRSTESGTKTLVGECSRRDGIALRCLRCNIAKNTGMKNET